jgi:8-oxo-dGTP diphosphatase
MRRLACVILVDPQGRLLLQERDEGAPVDPDVWGLVGGGVEPGEETEAAAYRELEEETGVVLPPGTLRHWREITADRCRHGFVGEGAAFIAATTLTDADIDCHEGRQIVFVDPAEFDSMPWGCFAEDYARELVASPEYAAMTQSAGNAR